MAQKTKVRKRSGVTSDAQRDYERVHRALSRRAAADGMVLLRNEGCVLPLDQTKPIALYGAGAVVTIKGGSGSGDVNARPTVSIWQGLKNKGFLITTDAWLSSYEKEYWEAKSDWRDRLWKMSESFEGGMEGRGGANFFDISAAVPFVIPTGRVPDKKEESDTADTAIFVISRTSGEGADRHNVPGDYRLTNKEEALLFALCSFYERIVLVLNTGGLMDLSVLNDPRTQNIAAILYMHQAGMEAGNAFADIVSGDVTPSAKLTDSWAFNYEDYPNALTYSHCNKDTKTEAYVEGQYVGYRYFDTFDKPVRYGFGFGLSYTEFAITLLGMTIEKAGSEDPEIALRVLVANVGNAFGREVIQAYVSCPQENQEKPFRWLVGYGKSLLLAPGQKEEMEIRFPLYFLASYDPVLPGWTMEEGDYILMAGESLQESKVAGVLTADQELIFSGTQNICPTREEPKELCQSGEVRSAIACKRKVLLAAAKKEGFPFLHLKETDVCTKTYCYENAGSDVDPRDLNFVGTLSDEQLISLVTGEFESSDDKGSALGSAGIRVPGSAAQTSACAEKEGLPYIVLADGPAGLRLNRTYRVLDGDIVPSPMLAAIEDGYLLEGRQEADAKAEVYYQYCTAFPAGTQLAQSWDRALLEEVGEAVGEELIEFGVTLWLAPGMNIHRNPLCGRNFEYYAEDPVVSGLCAAAITQGVQSKEGVGTTIKHFACNNQEDNRMGSNSILSERVLREIYLKGFEICMRMIQPMSIMTSYNRINGVHAANSRDLCTKVARCEWGFEGVIMTDWTTTLQGDDCTASGCIRAGNDLIMPGAPSDHENLRKELAQGTLPKKDLQCSVARLVHTIRMSRFG